MIILLFNSLLINTKQFDQLNITFLLGYQPEKKKKKKKKNDIKLTTLIFIAKIQQIFIKYCCIHPIIY